MLCKTGRLICYGKRLKIGKWNWLQSLFCSGFGNDGAIRSVKAADQTDLKTIDIMFVHDTHSHLNSFSTVVDKNRK